MSGEVNISGRRLQITRVFDAPRPMVFDWWTRPENMQQWSGCKEAVNCEVQMDFRAGGGFTQKMQIGDKCEFTITGFYEEIVAPERIVYRANLGPMPTRVTVEFFEEQSKTRLVLTHEGLADDTSVRYVAQGTTESFEKLHSLLSAAMGAGA